MSHNHHHNCDHDHDHDHSDDEDTHVTLYTPPTPIIFLRATAINLILPFINGLMLGFGELFAHEIAFRWGWGGTRVFPGARARPVGAGVEVREKVASPSAVPGIDRANMEQITSLE